jgi:thioredoxin-dependent peroxiredoxin
MPDLTDTAPDFTLPRDGGDSVRLADLRGGAVVLFFYPRDDTPGCTRESIGFSADLQAFAEADTRVFGVSRDSVASHQEFITKFDLKTPLLADESGEMCNAYDVWKELKYKGKSYMGVERTTFLIDRHGKIARIWRRVNVVGHVPEVLAAARALQSKSA